MEQFYRIRASRIMQDQWYLGAPFIACKEVDPRQFTNCQIVTVKDPITVSVEHIGPEIPVNFAFSDMPVISRRTLNMLDDLIGRNTQRIPAKIVNSKESYDIVNVLEAIECLDESKSVTSRWTESEFPEKAGQYRSVDLLYVNSKVIGDRHVFRILGWEIALIISKLVKDRLDQSNVKGVLYSEVT